MCTLHLAENGVCRPCRQYETSFGDWEAVKEQRKCEFEALLRQAQQLSRPYDCLIPLSGGKDSTYALYVCSKVYGLKCLCVTFDNGFLAEPARANIRRALEATNADHLMYTANRDHLLKLYRLFLEKSGDFCSVCMRGIHDCTVAARKAFDIPLVVNGGGNRIAYLNMMPEVFQLGNERFVRNVLSGEPLEKEAFPVLETASARGQADGAPRRITPRSVALKALRLAGRGVNRALRLLEPQDPGSPMTVTPVTVSVFDFLEVSPEQLSHVLEQEMGWRRPPDKLEHMDCLLHEIPFYMHTRKFPQLTANTFYRCGMVRWGLMTREEALRAEEEELANPRTPEALVPFLAEIGMTQEEFDTSVRDWEKLVRCRAAGQAVWESASE